MSDEDDTPVEEGPSGPSRNQADPPPLFVIEGDATPEQVAALTAVLSCLRSEEPAPEPRSEWGTPARRLRTPMASSWRSSGLPR